MIYSIEHPPEALEGYTLCAHAAPNDQWLVMARKGSESIDCTRDSIHEALNDMVSNMALKEFQELSKGMWDGVDADQYVRELRGDD